MSKKKSSGTGHTGIGSIGTSIIPWCYENQNVVYIAIIGFCLSVTILYKISQWQGS